MTPDIARLAALSRQILQNPKSTTPTYIDILRGWVLDALRSTRPQPTNPDWKALADFAATANPNSSQPRKPSGRSKLTFKRTTRAWRKELVAPFGNGGYWLVEQPGGRWAVNFMDHAGSLYAVDGVVLADTMEEGMAVCEQDAVIR